MTDNEKRAHDLSIAIVVDICHLKADAQIKAGDKQVTIDYFKEYIHSYETALETFEKKFPDSK